MVRSQTVGLDEFIARWTGRLRRRPYTGPPARLTGCGPARGYDCARGRYPPPGPAPAPALHDVIAGTAVIYSWDARAARLRYLSRG